MVKAVKQQRQAYSDRRSDNSRDSQQIRRQRTESQPSEDECDVLLRSGLRRAEEKSNGVDRPEVVIAERLPQKLRRDGLAVVHVALRRIVAQDAVNHDLLFAFTLEPAFRSVFAFRLADGWYHLKATPEPDEECDDTFKHKQPNIAISPSFRDHSG